MRRIAILGASASIVAAAAIACTADRQAGAWKAGDEYEALLRVVERPTPLPGSAAPTADSVQVRLTVDSVRADSVFGRYSGRFADARLPVDDRVQSPKLFVGVVNDTSMLITLAPDVVDAELILTAPGGGTDVSGEWRRQSPMAFRGTFQLRKLSGT